MRRIPKFDGPSSPTCVVRIFQAEFIMGRIHLNSCESTILFQHESVIIMDRAGLVVTEELGSILPQSYRNCGYRVLLFLSHKNTAKISKFTPFFTD